MGECEQDRTEFRGRDIVQADGAPKRQFTVLGGGEKNEFRLNILADALARGLEPFDLLREPLVDCPFASVSKAVSDVRRGR